MDRGAGGIAAEHPVWKSDAGDFSGSAGVGGDDDGAGLWDSGFLLVKIKSWIPGRPSANHIQWCCCSR